MAELFLPPNSRITGKGRAHRAESPGRVRKFRIYRWDPERNSGDSILITPSRTTPSAYFTCVTRTQSTSISTLPALTLSTVSCGTPK